MSNRQPSESTPLLDPEAPPRPSPSNKIVNRAVVFRIATIASLVTSVVTVIFLTVCIVLVSNAPRTYAAPFEISYTFAPIAGFSAIVGLHSGLVLLDGAPLRGTIAGILVDVFGGLYFLFQSLYGMQRFLVDYPYIRRGCHPVYGEPPPSLGDCERWRARVEPVFWLYLFAILLLGLAHVILLLLRAATYKLTVRELRVVVVDEAGNPIRF